MEEVTEHREGLILEAVNHGNCVSCAEESSPLWVQEDKKCSTARDVL